MGRKPLKISILETLIIKEFSALIDKSGISQKEIAEKTGIPESTLSKTLSTTRATNLDELGRLSEVLKVRLSDVLAKAEQSLVSETGFDTNNDNSNEESNVIAFPGRPREVPGSDLTALPEMA